MSVEWMCGLMAFVFSCAGQVLGRAISRRMERPRIRMFEAGSLRLSDRSIKYDTKVQGVYNLRVEKRKGAGSVAKVSE